ncbi:helix-turn-helix transcriptional regulator [Actinoplanes sp. M2I2]|uniref:helix-turn-helix transcriptional regulator n=1 Tax=Actinoplanes sp. M2I2 TaxID=1734444 RepID=UPI002020D64F|nr:helix-turn-helix transcriptional regulator [Actinoplanes sp. M2I2]
MIRESTDSAPSDGPARELMNEALVRGGNAFCATENAIHAVVALCVDDLVTGEWDEALRLADTGLDLCELHGYRELRWPLWVVTAAIAALRGDDQQAAEFAGKLADWARRRGSATVQLYTLYVQCLLAQSRGDFEQAFQRISGLAVPATFTANLPLALAASLDFVECAVRTDRTDAARAYVTLLQTADLRIFSPRLKLLTACATALAHPGDAGQIERSLAASGTANLPYDRARVQLAYAERLRRTRSLRTARGHLTDALCAFRELGAMPWQARAERQLRSAGIVANGPATVPVEALTPQERAIAELAASGLTNKQIGTRIYLSHRTVSTHLSRVFDKLGISTRAGLRDALGRTTADPSR